MKLYAFFCLILISLVFFAFRTPVSAQDFPSGLLQALPHAAEKLSSDDVEERASIMKEMVVPVPRSCTFEVDFPLNLSREDYVFVVGKVLEKDLRLLDEKTGLDAWGRLSHLVIKFEMKEFAAPLAAYLAEGYLNDPKGLTQYTLIKILANLDAKEFDAEIARFLRSPENYIRYLTLETLIGFRSKKAIPALVEKLREENSKVWALDKLVVIGALEAGPQIAEVLKDADEDLQYWAIDALARLNAKAQAKNLWQFVKSTKNERYRGFAIATLVQFEQKEAVVLAVDQLKSMAQGSENYYIWEFINKLKPKFLIPALISLYHTKNPFLANAAHEKKFRWQVYQTLVIYKTPLAIPIYREHLVDKHMGEESTAWRPSSFTANLLFELGATEALDDIISVFIDANKPGAHPDARTGAWELSTILAKFGAPKTWKMLIDYAEKTDYWGRDRIVEELNRQADKKLWDLSHSRVPKLVPAAPLKTVVEKISADMGIPISLEYVPKKEPVICALEDSGETDGYPCGYANGSDSLYNVVANLMNMLNHEKRGEYTFILDHGTIRILKTDKAIEWWRKNILTKTN